MIQVISYEIKNGIITVGFKVDNFVVYSNIPNSNKTKPQILQEAYEQVKKTIDYEKTLTTHSITSDKTGERFIPAQPKLVLIKLSLDKYNIQFEEGQESVTITPTTIGIDQYGDVINITPQYSITYGEVRNGLIVIPKSDENIEIEITASIGSVISKKKAYIEVQKEPFENIIVDLINSVKDKQSIIESNQVDVLENYNSIGGKVQDIEVRQNSLAGTQSVILNESTETLDYLLDYEFRLSMLELGL